MQFCSLHHLMHIYYYIYIMSSQQTNNLPLGLHSHAHSGIQYYKEISINNQNMCTTRKSSKSISSISLVYIWNKGAVITSTMQLNP